MADYIIIFLVALGMVAACRHIFKSWRSGSCPGCGGCRTRSSGKAEACCSKTEVRSSKDERCRNEAEECCGHCCRHK